MDTNPEGGVGDSGRGMSVRAWARSRGIPSSTAAKAAASGRIQRDARGLLDPERADREWVENTGSRINGRTPRPPEPQREEWVRVADALAVDRELTALLLRELVAEINRLSPALASSDDPAAIRLTLYGALRDAAAHANAKWPDVIDQFAESP